MAISPTKAPIEPGFVQRLVQGLQYTFTGAWFGPGNPSRPLAEAKEDQTVGRRFNYPAQYNVNTTPKRGEGTTFADLRGLADSYDLLRLCIETRKDQMAAQVIDFRFRDKGKKESDRRIELLRDFFHYPDKQNDWETWLRMLIEDLLVIDAPCIYPRLTLGGQLFSLDPVDGATINRILDGYGRVPMSPDPAYQQILHGMTAVDYTQEELIYRPRNMRTNRVYGFSPVEQIITTVNIALRRQLHQLQYFTDGNVPNSIFSVPETWNPDDVRQFQEWWDSVTIGTSKNYGRFVPHGVNIMDTKQAAFGQNDEIMNEWLSRVVCYCFNIAPTQLVKTNNRATSDTQKETADSEGLAPTKQWLKNLIDFIVHQYFGFGDLEMHYVDQEVLDPLTKAQIDKIYLDAKVLDPDEVRNDLGLDPLTPEQRERLAPPPQVPAAGGKSNAQDPPGGGEASDEPVEKSQRPLIGKLHLHMPPVQTGDTLIEAHFADGKVVEAHVKR